MPQANGYFQSLIPPDAQLRGRTFFDKARDVLANPVQSLKDTYQLLQPREEIENDPRWKLGLMPDAPSKAAMNIVNKGLGKFTNAAEIAAERGLVGEMSHYFVDEGGNVVKLNDRHAQ